MMTDYVPDKAERFGAGPDDSEIDYDYTIGHEPEMSQEEFSEILSGYSSEISGLKKSLSSVCCYYSQPGPRDPSLAGLASALAARGMFLVLDPVGPYCRCK